MLGVTKLKIRADGKSQGGAGGTARGQSASSILDYAENVQALDYYQGKDFAPRMAMGEGWQELGLQPGQQPTREQLENLLNGGGLNGEELAKIRAEVPIDKKMRRAVAQHLKDAGFSKADIGKGLRYAEKEGGRMPARLISLRDRESPIPMTSLKPGRCMNVLKPRGQSANQVLLQSRKNRRWRFKTRATT